MKMHVEYEDGTEKDYKVKPRHLVAFEEDFGEFRETAKSAYTLAHIASESPLSFTDWLKEVEDIQPVKERTDLETEAAQKQAAAEGEVAEPVPTE
jgi:hypothetical protein